LGQHPPKVEARRCPPRRAAGRAFLRGGGTRLPCGGQSAVGGTERAGLVQAVVIEGSGSLGA